MKKMLKKYRKVFQMAKTAGCDMDGDIITYIDYNQKKAFTYYINCFTKKIKLLRKKKYKVSNFVENR